MRISDWSSDVCSSDLFTIRHRVNLFGSYLSKVAHERSAKSERRRGPHGTSISGFQESWSERQDSNLRPPHPQCDALPGCATLRPRRDLRSEERRIGKECVSQGETRG